MRNWKETIVDRGEGLVRSVRAIILDFDGVLVDSNDAKDRAFADLCALYPSYGDAMIAYHRAHYSFPRRMKFEHYVHELMGRTGDVAQVQAMAARFSELVVQRVLAAPDVPGARAFLEEFAAKVPLYLSSVTPEDELRTIIRARGLDGFFAGVYGDPPCAKVDAIHTILSRQQLVAAEVILVGDSPADYRVAAEVGVGFVGRDSGLRFDEMDVQFYRDLLEIADLIRPWLA